MQFRRSPIAFAVMSLALPFVADAAPTVKWDSPTAGKTISGRINAGTNCQASGTGISRVQFFIDSTQLNADSASPFQCSIDTSRYPNGAHTMKVVAYDSRGASTTATVNVNIQNGTTSTPTTPTTPPPTTTPTTPPPTTTPTTPTTLPAPGAATSPNVWFKAPVSGNTVSGTLQLGTCYVKANGVNRVSFFLDSTPLNSDTNVADGMSCVLDTKKFADGAHKLVAMGYNSAGASYREGIGITIKNGTGTTPPTDPTTPPPSDPGTSLPSANTKAVPTFHSVGLYWKPGTNPGAAGCTVQYKKQGETAWKDGLNMWYDTRNSECRGSLVSLTPNTSYDVRMGVGSTFKAGLTTKTWNEQFKIAKTVYVPSGSS